MALRSQSAKRRATTTGGILLFFWLGVVPPAWTQDFYRERLERGRQALLAERFTEAVTDLEIACFGLMENPARRVGCKALLFLAQRGAGDALAGTETLRLVARLEERFAAFSGANLDAQTKRAFLVEADASQVDLSVWPRLQSAVQDVVGTTEDTTTEQRALSPSELERALRDDPANLEIATQLVLAQYERGRFADVQDAAEELLARDPGNPTASCLLAVATATRNRSMCARTLDAIETCSAELQNRRYARTRLQCYVGLERWQAGRQFSDQLPADIRAAERRLVQQIERRTEDFGTPPTSSADQPDSAQQNPTPPTPPPSDEANTDDVERLRRLQQAAVRTGDADAIANILGEANQLAQERPSDGPLRELAGQAAFLLSRWEDAIFHLEAADAVHEVSAFSLFYLATALEATGAIEAASQTLQRGLDAGLPRVRQVIALEEKLQTGG